MSERRASWDGFFLVLFSFSPLPRYRFLFLLSHFSPYPSSFSSPLSLNNKKGWCPEKSTGACGKRRERGRGVRPVVSIWALHTERYGFFSFLGAFREGGSFFFLALKAQRWRFRMGWLFGMGLRWGGFLLFLLLSSSSNTGNAFYFFNFLVNSPGL